MRIPIKVYIPKYDLQGDEVEVEVDEISDQKEWNAKRQSVIDDFIKSHSFNRVFKQKYRVGFSEREDTGVYTDNEMNRRLGRVGKTRKSRLDGLKDTIRKMVMDRNVVLMNEDRVIVRLKERETKKNEFVRRKWTDKEIQFVKENRSLTYRQIGMRLFRSQRSVESKARRIGIRRSQ